jgi:CubicO group peptidase (beta-lactamase class C family)
MTPPTPPGTALPRPRPQTEAEPGEVGLDAARLRLITDVLRADVERGVLPGAVWGVARGGRLAWVEALGHQGPAGTDASGSAVAPVAMRTDTVFRIYSMTKPIVSLAIMQLAESGRLLLTDPLSRWLPEFAGLQVAEERGAEVVFVPAERQPTVQDLLRHTAGFTYEFLGARHVHRRYQQAQIASLDRNNAEFCRTLATLPLAYQPGSCWEYSRATDVLGRLVEVASGLALGDYLQAHVFAPLGLHDTAFVVPPESHERLAEPFATDPDSGEAVRLLNPRVAAPMQMGGGGLMSTFADYERFTRTLLAGGSWGGVRLIGRKSLALMTADHLGDIPIQGDLLLPGHGFGLGFAVRTAAGLSGVPGSVGTYHWSGIAGTFFFVDPQEELTAILLTQAPGRRVYYRQLFRQMIYSALA